jgi:hypothetical protein
MPLKSLRPFSNLYGQSKMMPAATFSRKSCLSDGLWELAFVCSLFDLLIDDER